MAKSKIEWTDETWNPITGCNKISSGCLNCYAEKMHKRLRAMGVKKYQHDFNKPCFHPEELNKIPKGKNKIVFVCSMSDLFNKSIRAGESIQILNACRKIENKFVICTKRAERMLDILTFCKNDYSNCIFLVSIEGQIQYNLRMPHLVKIKEMGFKVGVSFEPLLGEIKMGNEAKILDWVIVGGETGKGAREMNPNWIVPIFEYCKKFNISFFFKKWGAYNDKYWTEKDNYAYNVEETRQYPRGWK